MRVDYAHDVAHILRIHPGHITNRERVFASAHAGRVFEYVRARDKYLFAAHHDDQPTGFFRQTCRNVRGDIAFNLFR